MGEGRLAASDNHAALGRAHREVVTRRLPRFGALWVGAAAIWALALHLQGRLTRLDTVLVPVLHGALLAAAIVVCRVAPEARRVRAIVFATCMAIGFASTALFVRVDADGDYLAFILLTLYVLAAIFFMWGWRTELGLVVVTVVPWAFALPRLEFHVPVEELLSAIAIGVVISLVVAEGSARAFAVAFNRRTAERHSREALRASRDEADAARVEAERARALAEAASAARDQFLAMLSHELRSPLTAVLAWTRMLRTGFVPDDKVPQALASIEEATRAQTRLVEDILDISRIAAGKFSLETEPVDLAALVRSHADTLRDAAAVKRIALEVRVPANASVRGDRTRLRQILENLFSNAIKFTPEGGRITIALELGPGEACVAVTDTGIGIPADVVPRVFEPFHQADRSITRRYGGLGLGLAIAHRLAVLHGGRIDAESLGEGHGATFRLHLPLASESTPAASLVRTSGATPMDGVLDRLHVLVVDDEPRAREVISALLSRCGAEVEVTASVSEALASVAARSPDVLLSDIAMPEADGYTLIRRIRALERPHGHRIAAIAVTALASAEDRLRALAEGFDAHLAKPVEPAELVAMVAASARGPG